MTLTINKERNSTLSLDSSIYNAEIKIIDFDFNKKSGIFKEIFLQGYDNLRLYLNQNLQGERNITKKGFINQGFKDGLEKRVITLDLNNTLSEFKILYKCLVEFDGKKYFKNPHLLERGQKLYLDLDENFNNQIYIMNVRQKYWSLYQ